MATVRGRVVIEGLPATDYRVWIRSREQRRYGPKAKVHDRAGRFEVHGVEPGTWNVHAVARGTRIGISADVVVDEGDVVDVETLTLERGPRLSGMVRDRRGALVQGACVLITDSPFAFSLIDDAAVAVTDEDGFYLHEGTATERDEELLVCVDHRRAGISTIRTVSATDRSADFELCGAGAIEGVLDVNISRVAAARRSDETGSRTAEANQEGRFRFPRLPPGTYAVSQGMQAHVVTVTIVDGETATVELPTAHAE